MHKKGEIRRLKRIKNYSYAVPQTKSPTPTKSQTSRPVSKQR